MNIYLIYFMIAVIFFIIIHSYYLPKNKYCQLNRSNNETEINNNSKNKNDKNDNQVKEGFDGHTEEDRRYIKVSDLKDLKIKTEGQIEDIKYRTKQINDLKEKNEFYRANYNLDSYKKLKKFMEDEKHNSRYHESLREYDRDYNIDKINKDYCTILSRTDNIIKSAKKGALKNIKSQNANHYIRVSQPYKVNNNDSKNTSKIDNINNPFTVFVNNGCLSFNNEDNSFKVSNMCNLTDSKQQFKFNKIDNKNRYNEIVKQSGTSFLYSIPVDKKGINNSETKNNSEALNKLDQPFYIINPLENENESTKCLTQLGEYLSVQPCNLHTNQRWIPDFQDRK